MIKTISGPPKTPWTVMIAAGFVFFIGFYNMFIFYSKVKSSRGRGTQTIKSLWLFLDGAAVILLMLYYSKSIQMDSSVAEWSLLPPDFWRVLLLAGGGARLLSMLWSL